MHRSTLNKQEQAFSFLFVSLLTWQERCLYCWDKTFMSRKRFFFFWEWMSLKVTSSRDGPGKTTVIKEAERQKNSFRHRVCLKKLCLKGLTRIWEPTAPTQAVPSVSSLASHFLLNTQDIHFTFTSAHQAKNSSHGAAVLPRLLRGVLLPSEETRLNVQVVHVWKCNCSWCEKPSRHQEKNEISKPPLVTTKDGARSSSRLLKNLAEYLTQTVRTASPDCFSFTKNVELFMFLHPSQYWWDIRSVEQWPF